MSPQRRLTGAAAILYALKSAGISHLFVNLGSDHPAFLLEFASQSHEDLQIFTSPNEMNALSAASGFAQITGCPAAVLVHVECGTQGLAGAIHNVSKGRIPVIILAGTVPITMAGEIPGSRNEYIHWIQDVPDQRAIVRQYMRYEHEIRRPHNAAQIVLRALQFALSSPQGPVYLIASRETLCEDFDETDTQVRSLREYGKNTAVEPIGLSPTAPEELTNVMLKAERPLIVTSYCGRSIRGFEALKAVAELLAIPVHENAPIYNNFPTTSFLHQGHQWNGGGQLPALAEADVVIVIDADVPWIPAQSKPSQKARIFHLDNDPLKEGMTLWSLPCERRWKCDSPLALEQLCASIRGSPVLGQAETRERIGGRTSYLRERFSQRRSALLRAEAPAHDGRVTVPYFMSRLREATADVRVVGLNESTTNLGNVADHFHHRLPLSLIGSGGGSLGWYSGGAVGASLALRASGRLDDLVVAFVGDGTWLFGVPSCAYWMAKKYETPFLTVIWNNGGWASPRNAFLRLNPGMAQSNQTEGKLSDRVMTSITPSPAFGKIAEGAGDAWWQVVRSNEDVDETCKKAIQAVREEKRCAVIEVVLDSV
ncbi:acetolactate synthase [Durotheca rogersii]|uniref:acetolactate synthase n=1 Tax=Durotheca rogersii TaxID=419775 RepID=UPI00222062DA|nr:acetolactate synthase [Durotheca rogersii]KAI5857494.1 acetolactate synthase [Durotheca rogersii]